MFCCYKISVSGPKNVSTCTRSAVRFFSYCLSLLLVCLQGHMSGQTAYTLIFTSFYNTLQWFGGDGGGGIHVYKVHLNIAYSFIHRILLTAPSECFSRMCWQLFMALYLHSLLWKCLCEHVFTSFFYPGSAHDLHAYSLAYSLHVQPHSTQYLLFGSIACMVWMERMSLCAIVYVCFVHVSCLFDVLFHWVAPHGCVNSNLAFLWSCFVEM